MKLNVGCGPNGQFEGFINIDNSKAVLLAKFPLLKTTFFKLGLISEEKYKANWKSVRWLDASKYLPFSDNSVNKIYTSHFLEHIPKDKGVQCLQECYRVLKRGGGGNACGIT